MGQRCPKPWFWDRSTEMAVDTATKAPVIEGVPLINAEEERHLTEDEMCQIEGLVLSLHEVCSLSPGSRSVYLMAHPDVVMTENLTLSEATDLPDGVREMYLEQHPHLQEQLMMEEVRKTRQSIRDSEAEIREHEVAIARIRDSIQMSQAYIQKCENKFQ